MGKNQSSFKIVFKITKYSQGVIMFVHYFLSENNAAQHQQRPDMISMDDSGSRT